MLFSKYRRSMEACALYVFARLLELVPRAPSLSLLTISLRSESKSTSPTSGDLDALDIMLFDEVMNFDVECCQLGESCSRL